MKKYLIKYTFIAIALIIIGAGIAGGLFYYYSDQLPPLSELQTYDMKTGSEVYDVNDKLIHVFAIEHRRRTDLKELPPHLVDGLLAVEDRRFYQHWGVDLRGIVRAVIVDIVRGGFAQGASTVTQQLARNMFLTFDKQIPRKIKEFMLAVKIEQNFAKDEILEMYMDKVYLGGGVYGVEAAAHRYFDKEAKELTIPEAALIIGLIQLPNAYSPTRFPERSLRRRNTVLLVMSRRGIISQEEYNDAFAQPLAVVMPSQTKGAADYFIEHVRLIVERKYGTTRLFTEGLKIYTTLDIDLQVYADSVLNREYSNIEQRAAYEFKYEDYDPKLTDIPTPYLQGGAFAIDPQTGYVKIMIGGRNFNHSKFNRITQARRQPGSAFKTFLYTAALQNRYTPATIVKDEPVHFVQSDTLFWAPRNYTRDFKGYVTLREAFNHSINTVAIKTIVDLGPSSLVDYGRRFGFSTPLSRYYSIAIGSFEVLPIELISAYTTFANGGERVRPVFVRRVEDRNGSVLESATIEKIRVIDERTAYVMADLLSSIVNHGTARGVRSRGYRWYAGGKTGTTDDYRDAWFIGFNSKLVLGLWAGFDDNTSLGRNLSGGAVALPPWPYIMTRAVEKDSPLNREGKPVVDASDLEIRMPPGVVKKAVSARTGLLPKSIAEEIIEEIFIAGTEPTPLSDSLSYNFYPTMFRENNFDTLFVNLGGKTAAVKDSTKLIRLDRDAPNVIIPRK